MGMERYRFSPQEQSLLEGLKQPFAVFQYIDKRVVPVLLSEGFCELFGYTEKAQAYRDMENDLFTYIHPDDADRVIDVTARFIAEGGAFEAIYRGTRQGSSDYTMIHACGRHVFTESGTRLAQIWYMDEGTYSESGQPEGSELNKALSSALHEESILKSNRYDYLTGLPSLAYFFEMAENGKNRISAEGGNAVLLYLDLYGMKYFNHKYGFREGDKLLLGFSRLLANMFGEENCCHIGADRFTAFSREDGLEDAMNRLFLEAEKINGGNSLPVKIGVYSAALADVPVSEAYDRAKIACDALRNVYASGYNFYSQALQDEADKRQYILSSLDRALQEKWVKVYYQPIVRSITGKVCDEEALARWIDPVRGFMSPADFIPPLESAGLIYKLDLYVLEQVLEKIQWQRASGLHVVPQSVNLSRADFDVCDIVEEIRKRVDAANISRSLITIEITESVIGSDFEFMRKQVFRFQELGFPVWMDDFGSGYSSLDVLQSIRFDLLKFDMGFMQKLDESERGRIILTELMKMATSLGLDTVCEGVETEAQARFLQEIGCSKLQGYYFCKPIPREEIMERNRKGIQIGFEDPAESSYNESISRVNLYDLAVIASGNESSIQNAYNTLPMGIIEINGDCTRFLRSNQSYRDFFKRFFGLELSELGSAFAKYDAAFMHNVVKTCCEQGLRSFYDEKMPDGSVIHSFARRVGINPVNGNIAVAIAVLSITDPNENTSYAEIARALAADYYNIYIIDLDTDRFIEYSSTVGAEELAMERHGTDFFASSKRDTLTRIYESDREAFLTLFTKENIIRELDEQGVFTATYRLIDSGAPVYANMKITRMKAQGNRIILGVSIVDSQMKQKELLERRQREEDAYKRVMALSGDYLSLYTVEPDTGRYYQFNANGDYTSLGLAITGDDFFRQTLIDVQNVVFPDDLPLFRERFTKENILRVIKEEGLFQIRYRLLIKGIPTPVSLKIVSVKERDGERLIAGVRVWRERE